ncbi:MAG: prephenate dehydratase [Pseudomonadota bacterium]
MADDDAPISLPEVREAIDRIDREIQRLISDRALLAQKVGVAKRGAADNSGYYRADREAQVLRLVVERNEGPLSDEESVRLFREIMSACLAQQAPLKIAFLGPPGTFTQSAALKHFGHSINDLPFATIDQVFHEVEAGNADFGVVPIENSTEGTVNHTLDLFVSSPLKICGEIELSIEQHLLGVGDTNLESIERICAHQQSLAQCRGWLRANLPNVELIGVSSNAEGARRARDEAGTAAIAGSAAAAVYSLSVLVSNIEDRADNTTRFLVLGKTLLPKSGDDKTALLLSANESDGAGALYNLLTPLSEAGINMSRIESRPSRRGVWDYVFFIDLDGHPEDPAVSEAVAAIESVASLCRVIGAYPRAVL